jgi:hypothetical protein
LAKCFTAGLETIMIALFARLARIPSGWVVVGGTRSATMSSDTISFQ